MYIPSHFAEHDTGVLHALIEAHPLGAWVMTQGHGELLANHIPFLVDRTRGPQGTLMAHVARANPVWQGCAAGVRAIVLFQGPEGYITPSWYPSKQAHGKAVPTWNYAVVHAHGVPRAIEDRDWLLAHVTCQTDTREAGRVPAWKVTDAPADYVERMLDAIVGIEMTIERLEGKWKTSQNRPEVDRLGVVAGLMAQGDEASRQMAALVSRQNRAP